ncbi:MAG: hypothetical protein M1834_008582 [Cirrosporium novae-zelandiae]|nr:MAG: hypothetical protein M1834_008582 [Cirrosporium novae-zelandiae]
MSPVMDSKETLTAKGHDATIASESKNGNIIESDDHSDDIEAYRTSSTRVTIGVPSAIFLIFNRMIGTGIFATPSSVVELSGSIGLALFIWVIGMLIAAAGMATYMEFGMGLPRNGGEKNYLEMVFRKPKFLVTCMYAWYVVLLGWAGSNSVIFGEYILNAAKIEVGRWNQRGIGLACITAAFLIHGLALKWGLRLQNVLGTIKLLILLLVVFSGFAALGGHLKIEKPHNFDNAFEGTSASPYGVVTALYDVIWSYIGYSNANYALSETKNPVRTLKLAAPLALGTVSILYMLANIAYFAAVPKEEIISSGRILAASFFRNVFGPSAERALSVFVALSAFGNVLSVIFSQGRLVQEFGREGVLPFSRLWASNKPLNAPFMGLFEHWLVSVVIMLAPPPGDAYNFILNLISYPLAIVNVFVAAALIELYRHPDSAYYHWAPPFRATFPVVFFFLLSNIYLVVAPFVPPDAGQNIYESLPYYLHCVVGIGIILAGAVYWVFWAKLLPWIGKYRLEKELVNFQLFMMVFKALLAAALATLGFCTPTKRKDVFSSEYWPSPHNVTGNFTGWGAVHVHDPSMIYYNGFYYTYTTHNLVGIGKSKDLGGPWEHAGTVLKDSSIIDNSGSDDPWAPDVHKIGDTFYCFYSVSSFGSQESSIGLATSQHPVGGWVDHGAVFSSSENSTVYPFNDTNAIDPNLFIDPKTSKAYINYGSFWSDLWQVPLKKSLTALISDSNPQAVHLSYDDIVSTHPEEGVFMSYQAPWYYLWFSHGTCCGYDSSFPAVGAEYSIHIGRSKNPKGPFVDRNGTALTNSGGTIVYGTNHKWAYGPGGQGVLTLQNGREILYFHYCNTNFGLVDEDCKVLGWDYIEYHDGWP